MSIVMVAVSCMLGGILHLFLPGLGKPYRILILVGLPVVGIASFVLIVLQAAKKDRLRESDEVSHLYSWRVAMTAGALMGIIMSPFYYWIWDNLMVMVIALVIPLVSSITRLISSPGMIRNGRDASHGR
jgi:divalent metal cation (Fe/Co/Zn/Cd) transporter